MPGGEDIRATVRGLSEDLLRRHVVRCADDVADPCGLRGLAAFDTADAEVRHLDRVCIADQHDVAGLDVAMHDALLVREAQGRRQLRADGDGLRQRQLRIALEPLRERHAVDELHRDVGQAVLFTDVVDGDDIGMRERPGALGLANEPDPVVLVARQFGLQNLDRDGAIDFRVVRLVHRGHRPRPEDPGDSIATDLFH